MSPPAILLSFAQFEREMISERTRDKIAATRRKGKWSGGQPLLGYDVQNTKLVVNEAEAFRVREIFDLYLQLGTVLKTVKELNRRGWRTKEWVTKKEKRLGGRPFTKTRTYHLLTNVIYIGKVRYKREVHAGEHAGIVDDTIFRKVQESLQRNGRCGGRLVRNKSGALLKGILKCASCNCGMTPTFSGKGSRLYRYYVCNQAQQRGWATCPAPSVPAGEIEKFVVDELRPVASAPAVLKEVASHLRQDAGDKSARLCRERDLLRQETARTEADLARQAMTFSATPSSVEIAVQLNERLRIAQARLTAGSA